MDLSDAEIGCLWAAIDLCDAEFGIHEEDSSCPADDLVGLG